MERTCVSRVRGFSNPNGGGIRSQCDRSGDRLYGGQASQRRATSWLIAPLVLFFHGIRCFAADLEPLEQAFRGGHYAKCRDMAQQAIAANEPSERCRILLLKAQLELGEYPQAAESLRVAREAFPHSLELRWLGRDIARYTGHPEQATALEAEILEKLREASWRYGDPASRLVLGRLLLKQGLEPKRVQEGTYNVLKKQLPNYVPAWLAAGELALEKTDFALAAENFLQAAKLEPDNPDTHFGVARAFAPSDDKRATKALQAALNANPRHVPSLLMAAEEKIDNEDYPGAEVLLDLVEQVNPEHPLSLANRALLAHLRNQPEKEHQFREAALATWPTNPEVDYLLGRKLSQKYRFKEGAEAQRRALIFDPQNLPARIQLAQDLLRLGQEHEGWEIAAAVAQEDGYNIFAHNLATLRDTVDKFQTLSADGILLRMDPHEAEIYGERVLALLKRAKQKLGSKYQVELPEPILVEMFPKQSDFAIRTFGMPGGEGFLGVCFGTVITLNSPASQADSPTCWEATLWHEFCHVVTLTATHNRMPRWLSEGISVYEEGLASPGWGQAITPRTRNMLLAENLTPVSRLSSAFLHPESHFHLQFAYLESALVVEYLVDTYGFDSLIRLLADLKNGITINDALGRLSGSVDELDRGFTARAREWGEQLAPEVDWSEPKLPADASDQQFADWVALNPKNYLGLAGLARRRIANRQWEQALVPLDSMRQLYPRDPTRDGLYGLLARAHRELKNTQAERAALEDLVALNPTSVESLDRLTELARDAGDWTAVSLHAERWLSVNPLQATPHRRLAEAATELGRIDVAADSYEALLRLDPLDPSDLRVRLGELRLRQGDAKRARREALLALERTPRFRAAQHLLLHATNSAGTHSSKPLLSDTVLSPHAERPTAPDLPVDPPSALERPQ
jgi:tetratricopeptide (TPR) repeat protein